MTECCTKICSYFCPDAECYGDWGEGKEECLEWCELGELGGGPTDCCEAMCGSNTECNDYCLSE